MWLWHRTPLGQAGRVRQKTSTQMHALPQRMKEVISAGGKLTTCAPQARVSSPMWYYSSHGNVYRYERSDNEQLRGGKRANSRATEGVQSLHTHRKAGEDGKTGEVGITVLSFGSRGREGRRKKEKRKEADREKIRSMFFFFSFHTHCTTVIQSNTTAGVSFFSWHLRSSVRQRVPHPDFCERFLQFFQKPHTFVP